MKDIKQVDFFLLRHALESLRRETRPIEGHTDPGALQDCWEEVFEDLDALETRTTFHVSSRLDDLEKNFS